MSWCEFITDVYRTRPVDSGCVTKPAYFPAAYAHEISAAENRLRAKLPVSLRSLLQETNGVMEMLSVDGGEWHESMWLLWSITEIIEQNQFFRAETANGTNDRDFSRLLFLAGAGCDGILFAFPITGENDCASSVVVWHPIEDELTDIANSLEDFVAGWLTGAISV